MIISSMKGDKRELISEFICCFVLITILAVISVLCFTGAFVNYPAYQQIGVGISCIVGIVITFLMGISRYQYYKATHYPPVKKTPSEYDKRRSAAQRRLPGKDIYGMLLRLRIKTTLILFVILLPTFSYLAVLLKAGCLYDVALSLQVKVALAVTVVISVVYFLTFPSSEAVRKTMETNGVDPDLINDDMMQATHHRFNAGLVILGKKNIVIYQRKICYIDTRSHIKSIVTRHEDEYYQHYDSWNYTRYTTKFRRYFVDLKFEGGYTCTLRMKDHIEAEIFLEKLHV